MLCKATLRKSWTLLPEGLYFYRFIVAIPWCPVEFLAPHFPTEHTPHLARTLLLDAPDLFLWQIVGIPLLAHP